MTPFDNDRIRAKGFQLLKRIRGIKQQALRERGSGTLVMRLDNLETALEEMMRMFGVEDASEWEGE